MQSGGTNLTPLTDSEARQYDSVNSTIRRLNEAWGPTTASNLSRSMADSSTAAPTFNATNTRTSTGYGSQSIMDSNIAAQKKRDEEARRQQSGVRVSSGLGVSNGINPVYSAPLGTSDKPQTNSSVSYGDWSWHSGTAPRDSANLHPFVGGSSVGTPSAPVSSSSPISSGTMTPSSAPVPSVGYQNTHNSDPMSATNQLKRLEEERAKQRLQQ